MEMRQVRKSSPSIKPVLFYRSPRGTKRARKRKEGRGGSKRRKKVRNLKSFQDFPHREREKEHQRETERYRNREKERRYKKKKRRKVNPKIPECVQVCVYVPECRFRYRSPDWWDTLWTPQRPECLSDPEVSGQGSKVTGQVMQCTCEHTQNAQAGGREGRGMR